MVIRIDASDVNGWPILNMLQPSPNHKDKLRLINFAQGVMRDLKFVCDKQRELTKMAKEGKLPRGNNTFRAIFMEAVLNRSIEDFTKERVKEFLLLRSEEEILKYKREIEKQFEESKNDATKKPDLQVSKHTADVGS